MSKVIFLHILKCGGTSMRYALLEQYGYENVAPVPIGAASADYAYPYLRGVDPLQYQATITSDKIEGYSVVMSHYDWGIVDRLPSWDVITLKKSYCINVLKCERQYILTSVTCYAPTSDYVYFRRGI